MVYLPYQEHALAKGDPGSPADNGVSVDDAAVIGDGHMPTNNGML